MKVTHCLLYFVDVICKNSQTQISNILDAILRPIDTSEHILLMQAAAVQDGHSTTEEEEEHDHVFTPVTGPTL